MVSKDNQVKLLKYLQPHSEEYFLSPRKVICDSPDEGESEDVEYEEWP